MSSSSFSTYTCPTRAGACTLILVLCTNKNRIIVWEHEEERGLRRGMNNYSVLNSVPGTIHKFPQSSLMATVLNSNYPHFKGDETDTQEVKWLALNHVPRSENAGNGPHLSLKFILYLTYLLFSMYDFTLTSVHILNVHTQSSYFRSINTRKKRKEVKETKSQQPIFC